MSLTQAQKFRKVIENYHSGYAQEIEAIAKAAQVDPLWIFALNSRITFFLFLSLSLSLFLFLSLSFSLSLFHLCTPSAFHIVE